MSDKTNRQPGTNDSSKETLRSPGIAVPIVSFAVVLILSLARIITPQFGLYEGIYSWLGQITIGLVGILLPLALAKKLHLPIWLATAGTIASIAIVVTLTLVTIWYVQSNPGRQARAKASNWSHVVDLNFNRTTPCTQEVPDDYSTGTVCDRDGFLELRMVMTSTQSASRIAHASSTQSGSEFYAETRVRLRRGPQSANCAMIFGYRDEQHWYAFRVQDDGIEVTRFKDHGPSRSLFITDFANLNVREWNKIAIFASGGTLKFFVNDRQLSEEVDQADVKDFPPAGTVDLGAISANTVFTGNDIRCDFDDFSLFRRAP